MFYTYRQCRVRYSTYAIGGLSMSGTSALNLASRHPEFYKSVASYSGYPTVAMPGLNSKVYGVPPGPVN